MSEIHELNLAVRNIGVMGWDSLFGWLGLGFGFDFFEKKTRKQLVFPGDLNTVHTVNTSVW